MASPLSAFTNQMHPKQAPRLKGGDIACCVAVDLFLIACLCRAGWQVCCVYEWNGVEWSLGGCQAVCACEMCVAGHAMNLGEFITHTRTHTLHLS